MRAKRHRAGRENAMEGGNIFETMFSPQFSSRTLLSALQKKSLARAIRRPDLKKAAICEGVPLRPRDVADGQQVSSMSRELIRSIADQQRWPSLGFT